MSDFEVVDDALRTTLTRTGGGRGQPLKPEYDALVEGKTVFFPINGQTHHKVANRVRSSMRARKYKVTSRTAEIGGVPGIVAWVTGKLRGA